jgi:hypothetical protein
MDEKRRDRDDDPDRGYLMPRQTSPVLLPVTSAGNARNLRSKLSYAICSDKGD